MSDELLKSNAYCSRAVRAANPAKHTLAGTKSSPLNLEQLERALANPQSAAPQLLAAQQAYGNRAVNQLLQAKFTVGAAKDVHEQEAERTAENVITEQSVGFKSGVDSGELLANQQGGGSPLPVEVRNRMEPHFGVDFSDVRVHTDTKAAKLNQALSAQAFTQGHDIYFDRGKYDPVSKGGRHLLAHELTHVVQQRHSHGSANIIQRKISAEGLMLGLAAPENTEADKRLIEPIISAITTYNGLSEEPDPSILRLRFSQLQEIDRAIYAYFNEQETGDLLETNYGKALKGLLKQTETERTAIVKQLRTQKAPIPFGNLQKGEKREDLNTLWESLRSQKGQVKIEGSEDEQDVLYGRMASLLQTPMGRKLVKSLDTQKAGKAEILFSGSEEHKKKVAEHLVKNEGFTKGTPFLAGRVETDVNQMVKTKASHAEHFPFIPGRDLATEPDMLRRGGSTGAVVSTADDYVKESLKPQAARPGALNIGGANYQFGRGMESRAYLSKKDVLDEHRAKASSASGHEVLTPPYISMAHELGHSAKMASGAYLSSKNVTGGLSTFIPDETSQRLWGINALEEFVNVKGIENPIREQSGLKTRDYYETPENVRASFHPPAAPLPVAPVPPAVAAPVHPPVAVPPPPVAPAHPLEEVS